MYKMRLQEVCQKRQWVSPSYTGIKCGPDHEARFGASVSVNGMYFDSDVTFNSLKQAHNYVARLAFLHFTSSDLSVPIEKPHSKERILKETHESVEIKSNSVALIHDIESRYKILLLKYAKQRNLDLPLYSSESDGHSDSLFKAKVRVSERVFESPESFVTSKEAENAAAKTALISLLAENFHKDDLRAYKSLLQELTQGEGFCAPVYMTTNFGAPHNPVFSSVVDLEGEIFHGKPAKSKKLAELEAARVAYLALTKRVSRISSKSTLSTGLALLRSLEHECHENLETEDSSVIEALALSPLAKLDRPSLPMPSSIATNSTAGASPSPSTGPDYYLLCDKVRVYSEFPSQAFPEGVVVLPVGEEKWVAVSLEFPNEETN